VQYLKEQGWLKSRGDSRRKGTEMGTAPKEVIYRHVLMNSTYEMANADPVGFYFDGGMTLFYNYPDRVITHFMPCYGPAHTNKRTAEYVRKIDWYKVMSARDIMSSGNETMISLFHEQLAQFPGDRRKERIHVFQLGEKTLIPSDKQNFKGGAFGYFELSELF
jgi:hypothetical protein